MIYKSAEELIGKTPLVELSKIEEELSLKSRIIAKLEFLNPAGSSKDRTAKTILDMAEEKGQIKKGDTIIEATSGNTGIALSMLGAIRGYRVIIVMPDTMSKERIAIMRAYGAEVVLTNGEEGMAGANKRALEIKEKTDGAFMALQFENPSNPYAHYLTTGPEIYENTEGRVDIFVSSIGTGGTISGVGKYLKERNPEIKVYGVEPENSPLLTKGVSGKHKIQGIGANFIPDTYDASVCDKVFTVKDEDAYEMARLISKKEGICVGISSGATLKCAIEIAKKEENKNIVVLLPDTGMRYLSDGLFD